jgi:hypothetical protein
MIARLPYSYQRFGFKEPPSTPEFRVSVLPVAHQHLPAIVKMVKLNLGLFNLTD